MFGQMIGVVDAEVRRSPIDSVLNFLFLLFLYFDLLVEFSNLRDKVRGGMGAGGVSSSRGGGGC